MHLPAPAVHEGPFAPDFPLWDRYFRGWVGEFGWGDYEFPGLGAERRARGRPGPARGWAVALAVRHWGAFVRRWPEWLSYAGLALGMLFLLGYTGYG